jgi:hypothetical protein
MIRTLLQRYGIGVAAATGLCLIALAVAGVAGLQSRLDAATPPAPSSTPAEGPAHDCPRDRDRLPASSAEL